MYILAIVLINLITQVPPVMLAPPTDGETCFTEAQRRNVVDHELQSKQAKEAGAAYICLHIEYPI